MTFAEHMRHIRGNQTQSAFSKRLRIPLITYQRYEKGSRVPDIEVFTRIAQALGVSADTLLGLDGVHGALIDGTVGTLARPRLSSSCPSDPKDAIIDRQAEIIETLTQTIESLAERVQPEAGGTPMVKPGESPDEITAA